MLERFGRQLHPSAGWVIASVAVIVVVVACSGATSRSGPSPSIEPITVAIVRDGVRLTLTLEGPPQSAVRSWADVRIENTAANPVRWAGGGCGDPAGIVIDVRADFDPGRVWPGLLGRFKSAAMGLGNAGIGNPDEVGYVEASRIGKDVACPADLSIEQLAAGAELSMRAAWDGLIQGAASPTGPATVTASFPFIGVAGAVANDETKTHQIDARVDTAVVGTGAGVPVRSPALIVDAALADAQFAAWVQGAPEARWINPELDLLDGVWTVGLFRMSVDGQGELFRAVKVDANGTIVGRRFDP